MNNNKKNENSTTYLYHEFRLDFTRCHIYHGQNLVELEPKVMAVLALLYQHQGEVLTQQHIFDTVWPGRIFNQSLVQRAITLIRKALGESATNAAYLITYPKRGYSLSKANSQHAISNDKNTTQASLITKIASGLTRRGRFAFIASVLISVIFITVLSMTQLANFDDHIVSANNQQKQRSSTHAPLSFSHLQPLAVRSEDTSNASYYGFVVGEHGTSDLFVKHDAGQYTLWQKEHEFSPIYSSQHEISFAFWLNNSPAVVIKHEQGGWQVVSLNNPLAPLFISDMPFTSAPQWHKNYVYFSTEKALYRFDLNTQSRELLLHLANVQQIRDFALDRKNDRVAILSALGQGKFNVNVYDLAHNSPDQLLVRDGVFRSIDFHPSGTHLLLSDAKQLVQLDFNQTLAVLPFATDKHIVDAQYASDGAILLQLSQVVSEIAHYTDSSASAPNQAIRHFGLNLFASQNRENQLLYFSNYRGGDALYLKASHSEKSVKVADLNHPLNGVSWHPEKQQYAFIANQTLMLASPNEPLETKALAQSVYLRDWYHGSNHLLVNELDNGNPYPAQLALESGTLRRLTEQSASCATLDAKDNLYYVIGKHLYVQKSDGSKTRIHQLTSGDYGDLFVSDHYLYALTQSHLGYGFQVFSLESRDLVDEQVTAQRMLAGVTLSDQLWFYDKITRLSEFYRLN